jgi:co-chaperonin GroES (HSP10)
MVSNATIHFDRKCVPASEYVVLRVIDRNDSMCLGGILVAEGAYSNNRLGFYQVEEVGEKAAEEYGLKRGDYVLADRLAQVYKTAPISVMKYINVIARTNADNTQYSPLKNMVFVKDEKNSTQNVGGILVSNYSAQVKVGEVVAMNIDDSIRIPFKKGDKVMLSKGGDSFQIGTEHVYIYKYDMIVCVVKEEQQ